MSQFPHRAKALFDRVFPERQIYHRSGGTVRYVSLKPSHQALMALAGVGIAGWCAYAPPWIDGNAEWRLPAAPAEVAELEDMLATCPG